MRSVALILLLAGPSLASAEDEDGTIKPVSVTAKLAGSTVELAARFAIDVDQPGVSLASDVGELPRHAIVTSATASANGRTKRLSLVTAEEADRTFDAISLKPGGRDRTFAVRLASTRHAALTVDIAAPRSARVVLDLSLTMPSCFFADKRYVEVPSTWAARLGSTTPLGASADDLDTECGTSGADDETWIAFPSRELARRPSGDARVGTFGARLPLGERDFARVEVDVASKLSTVPADLVTAIVIDRSRSMQTDALESQRAIVASYLQRAPQHSRIQVIAYGRRPEPLLPAWMTVAASKARLDREIRGLAPVNGSNLDAAIAEAGRWLARVKGTHRLIVFTDESVSERVEGIAPSAHVAALPAGTVVHVVSPRGGGNAFTRDDESLFAPLASATSGIALVGGTDEETDGFIDATMLLRPIPIDRVEVSGAGWKTMELTDRTCDGVLGEGSSCVWWGEGKAIAGPVTFEGFVWGRRFTRVVRPDPSRARELARILSAIGSFDEEVQQLVDRAALALNPVWSMMAIWGGPDGYEDLGGGGTLGFRGSGCCHSDTFGHGGFGTVGFGAPLSLDLRNQIEPAVKHCNRGAAAARITIETTVDEIVEVAVDTADERARECMTEAVWETWLAIPKAPPRATSVVQL